MTKPFVFLLSILTCLGAGVQAQEPVPPESLIGEDAFLFISISDLPRTFDRFEASPMAALQDGKDFAGLRGFLGKQMFDTEEDSEAFKELGKHMDGFLECIQGPVAIAVTDIGPMMKMLQDQAGDMGLPIELPDNLLEPGDEPDDAELEDLDLGDPLAEMREILSGVFTLAYVGDQQPKLNRWMQEMVDLVNEEDEDAGLSLEKKTIDGREFHQLLVEDSETPQLMWSHSKGYALLGVEPVGIAKMAARIEKGGVKNPLVKAEHYARGQKAMPKADGRFYMNPFAITSGINNFILGMADMGDLGIDPKRLVKTLDLEAFAPVQFSFQMVDEGIRSRSELGFNRETKVSKLLMTNPGRPVVKPEWVSRDVTTVNVTTMDLGQMYNDLIALVTDINPQAGFAVGAARMMVKGQTGIDLKKDLLDEMEGTITIIQELDPDSVQEVDALDPLAGQSMLIAMELKDGAGMQKTIEKMMETMNEDYGELFEKKEFMGRTIYKMVEDSLPMEMGVNNDTMLLSVGLDKGIRDTIKAGAKKPAAKGKKTRKTKSLWTDKTFKAALAELPPKPCAIAYAKGEALFQSIGEAFGSINAIEMELEGGPEDAEEDETGTPDFSVLSKIFSAAITGSYREDHRMVGESIYLYTK